MTSKFHQIIGLLVIFVLVFLLMIAGCGDSKKSCPSEQYKAKPVGDCDNAGVCTEKPEVCPDVWAPVCGCDGITYGNACEAAAAGVNIDSEDACTETCNSNIDITDPANYCEKQEGDCDGVGKPAAKPEACPEIWVPVCGCDGNTYGNACEAAAAGVNIASEGGCLVTCNSNADIADPAYYCEKQNGDCGGVGSSVAKPNACTDLWDPVCGCDGNTYGNACEAAVAGVNILSDGSCP